MEIQGKPDGRLIMLIVPLLAVFAVATVVFRPAADRPAANPAATTEIDAFSFQIRPGVDGIAVFSKNEQTLCLYQYQAHRPAYEGLVLLASRKLTNDFKLQDYNNAEPTPSQVENMLQNIDDHSEEKEQE